MPGLAKAYIAMIAAIAATVLTVVASRWNSENFLRFLLFFGLAMVGSAMKIRLPGFKTTISTNFVFILVALPLFSSGETVLIGLGGALVQSLWKAQQRPKAMQVFFNASCLTVCTAAAFWISHAVPPMLRSSSVAGMMVLGGCVYLPLNTGLVSLVISVVEGRSFKEIWSSCYEWTFPYFLLGAAVAGLASSTGHGANLASTLLVVSAMYFVHVYYRMHVVRAVLDNISSVSQKNEALLVSATRGS